MRADNVHAYAAHSGQEHMYPHKYRHASHLQIQVSHLGKHMLKSTSLKNKSKTSLSCFAERQSVKQMAYALSLPSWEVSSVPWVC